MSWRSGRSRNGRAHRPPREPAGINYAIVAGETITAPRTGEGVHGGTVMLLGLLIPVVNPERPQEVSIWTPWDVEVPSAVAARHRVQDLDEGRVVMAAGQISERSVAGNGIHRNVLLAEIVHPWPPDPPSIVVVGGAPEPGPPPLPIGGNGAARPDQVRPCEGGRAPRGRRRP